MYDPMVLVDCMLRPGFAEIELVSNPSLSGRTA